MNLEILLSAIKAKDKNAFNALYDETINQIYSLAYKITRTEDLAEEVVGEFIFKYGNRQVSLIVLRVESLHG